MTLSPLLQVLLDPITIARFSVVNAFLADTSFAWEAPNSIQELHLSRHSAVRTAPPVLSFVIKHGPAPASTRTILSLRSWECVPSTQSSADPRIYLSQESEMLSAFATISKKEMLAYTRFNHSAEFQDSKSVTPPQTSSWAQFNYLTLLSLRLSSVQMLIDALLLEIKLAPAGL